VIVLHFGWLCDCTTETCYIMALQAAFDRLWLCYCSDIRLDDAVEVELNAFSEPLSGEDVEALLRQALDKSCSEVAARGTELAVLMLRQLELRSLSTPGAVVTAIAKLQEPENLEDLTLDCPQAPQLLADMIASFDAKSVPRRLRVLAVRNGFSPGSAAAKAVRRVAELRMPGSPHIAETGNEDAGGKGEQETIDIIRQHLQKHEVDLVIAQSRGCRLLAEHIVGGSSPCWSGPVLALSPAGEWGLALTAAHSGRLLIAASGNDLIELGGAHPVIQRSDVEAMAVAVALRPATQDMIFEEERRCGWDDAVVPLLHQAVTQKPA